MSDFTPRCDCHECLCDCRTVHPSGDCGRCRAGWHRVIDARTRPIVFGHAGPFGESKACGPTYAEQVPEWPA